MEVQREREEMKCKLETTAGHKGKVGESNLGLKRDSAIP